MKRRDYQHMTDEERTALVCQTGQPSVRDRVKLTVFTVVAGLGWILAIIGFGILIVGMAP